MINTGDAAKSSWQQMKEYLLDPEHYYAMPAVGVTEERVKIDGVVSRQFTIRCGERNCWFIGHSPREQDVQTVLDSHTCPQAPARNELPTGYSTLEKTWDELDEAMAAILEEREWQTGTRTMRSTTLQGYCRGIAFTLSMLCAPHFRTADEIIREAVERYKMRTGKIPFRQTPTYRYNPMPAPSRQANPAVVATKPAPGKASPSKRAPLAAKKKPWSDVDLSSLTAEQSNNIRKADAAGMMDRDTLARMYSITRATVDAICGN